MRLAVVVVSVGVAASAWAGTVLERIEVVRTDPFAPRVRVHDLSLQSGGPDARP